MLAAAVSSGRTIICVDKDGVAGISCSALVTASQQLSSEPLTDVTPHPGRAIASGGSTGLPKIIAETKPHVAVPDDRSLINSMLGRESGQTALVLGPMYHTLSIGSFFCSLLVRG